MSYTDRPTPRVRLHRTGRVSLAGLSYRDLSQILTCAALHCHEGAHGGCDGKRYAAILLRVVNAASAALDGAIREANARQRAPREPLTRRERLVAVKAERAERLLLDGLVTMAINMRRKG